MQNMRCHANYWDSYSLQVPNAFVDGDQNFSTGGQHGASDDVFSAQLEEVRARMEELAKNLGDTQRRSKKERATQKTAFRDCLYVLDGQGMPEVKIKARTPDAVWFWFCDCGVMVCFIGW